MIRNTFVLLLACCFVSGPTATCLKAVKKVNLPFSEPSDICYYDHHYFFACDNGFLRITNDSFRVLKKIGFEGADLEGVWADEKHIYLSNESGREIITLNRSDYSVLNHFPVEYHGGRNLGLESLTRDPEGNYYSAGEKEPVQLMKWNAGLQMTESRELEGYNDISGMTWHDGYLYILSDEDQTVTKVNSDYTVNKRWKIPVYNPEGICFNPQGQLLICSDRMSKLYVFNLTAE